MKKILSAFLVISMIFSGLFMGGMNVLALSSNTVSGKIFMPLGMLAPAGGITGTVYIYDQADVNYYSKSITIAAGQSSIDYAIKVPSGKATPSYIVSINISTNTNLVLRSSYYSSSGATIIYSLKTLINTRAGNLSGIDITLIKASTISGRLILPAAQLAPVGGIGFSLRVSDSSGNYSFYTSPLIAAGTNFIDYVLVVPFGTDTPDYKMSFNIYSNSTGYISKGYYSTGGTTVYSYMATFINTRSGNLSGYNMTILQGNSIAGRISLPIGATAPVGGISGSLYIVEKTNSSNNYNISFAIPAGANFINYSITVPFGAATPDYYVNYVSNYTIGGYLDKGYYSSTGTKPIQNLATSVNTRSGSISGIDMLFAKGHTISGKLSLPTGVYAPSGGLSFSVAAADETGLYKYYEYVTIPTGASSVNYSISVPQGSSVPDFIVNYYIGDYYGGFIYIGYYSKTGTSGSIADATKVNARITSKTGINMKIQVLPFSKINISKTKATVKITKTLQLTAKGYPSLGASATFKWKSSDTKVATVTAAGKVMAKSVGTATITATSIFDGKKATCKISVIRPVTSVKLNKTSITILKNKTFKLSATVSPNNATIKSVKWKTLAPLFVSVSSNGTVKGLKKGSGYVMVTTVEGGKTAKCKVTVK
ncbi:MAG: Ig-like domain-containing protein [Clostridia bacterium]